MIASLSRFMFHRDFWFPWLQLQVCHIVEKVSRQVSERLFTQAIMVTYYAKEIKLITSCAPSHL